MEKILVVDDERINLMMVNKILGSDYEIMEARSGAEALDLLEEITPTIVLLDIHMEGMDGYEVIQKMYENERLKKVPVIFLTADDDTAAEVKGFELGADDFIKKPFVSAVVKRRVERSIEHHKLRNELQKEVAVQTETAQKRGEKLQLLSLELIKTLTGAIDAKDIYTRGHSARVAEYAGILGKKLGWSEDKLEQLRYSALLHDIGKIGVPDRVLNKDGKLTDDEFELIKSHTTIGSDLLHGISSFSDMYLIARNHHERYDGTGYPDRLAAMDIPEGARLIGVVDAYDAMSSDRVYRKALPREVIRDELVKGRGSQFDPYMLDCFLELFDNNELVIGGADIENLTLSRDIDSMIKSFIPDIPREGAIILNGDELEKIYTYVQNVHNRFGLDFNTVLITLSSEMDITAEELERAMRAMEFSIVQSLRKVDVCNRVSVSQFFLVLTEAHSENVKMIVDRIFAGFYKNYLGAKIKLEYEMK